MEQVSSTILNYWHLGMQILLLAQKLELTGAELKGIAKTPSSYDYFNILDLASLNLPEIQNLYELKQLINAFNDMQNQLIDLIADQNSLIKKLSKLSDWPQDQIKQTQKILGKISPYLFPIPSLKQLKKAFDLINKMGADVNFVEQILNPQNSSLSEKANWQTYQDVANAVRNRAKDNTSDDKWATTSSKIEGRLDELTTQHLTNYAIWKLESLSPAPKNLRELSEYLLLDVEMTSCAHNSPIQLGQLSLQMYLQRCRLNLEPGVDTLDIPETWWEWIMNYRVWQANREIFLYPENYLNPTLRRHKSPEFAQLEQELLQAELTTTAVEAAYHKYFTRFEKLAQLQIVEGYRTHILSPNSPAPVDTLFVFGRTTTEPYTYYYRTCTSPTAKTPLWGYWHAIPLQIHSDYISPIYAFNRLFVFWVESKQITKTSLSDGQTTSTETTTATIKYSFLDSSNAWVQPQTLVSDVKVATLKPSKSSSYTSEPTSGKVFWKKVYPELTLNSNFQKAITILFGDLPPISPQLFKSIQVNHGFRIESTLMPSLAKEMISGDSLDFAHPPEPQGTNLSHIRAALAATAVGDLVIFAGGTGSHHDKDAGGSQYVNSYQYDATSQSLISHKNLKLSRGRFGLAAATIANFVLFAGGTISIVQDNKETNKYITKESECIDVFEYDGQGSLKLSSIKPTLSQARANLSATTVDNFVIFAGGGNNVVKKTLYAHVFNSMELKSINSELSVSDNVDVFKYGDKNITNYTQKAGLNLSIARTEMGATTVVNFAIFAGGVKLSDYYSSNHSVQLPDLPLVAASEIDVFVYDSNTNTLKVDNKENLKLSKPRFGLAATAVGHYALFAGGCNFK